MTLNRREFLRITSGALGAISAVACVGCGRQKGAKQGQLPAPTRGGTTTVASKAGQAAKVGKNRHDPHPVEDLDVVVSTGSDPAAALEAGLKPFGGIESFVRRGDTVVIKPNLTWARFPEQAATTQPAVLAAVCKACRDGGASEVLVVEHTCDRAVVAFEMSGALEALQALKVPLISLDNERLYDQVQVSQGVNIREEQIARDILEADCYINLPIAKVHGATLVTLAMKNQLGAVWRPQRYHEAKSEEEGDENLHQNIADLATALRPTLNVVDCTRVLLTNGPKGPGRVEQPNALVISPDIVAADSVACEFLHSEPDKIGHIRLAAGAGVGRQAGLKVKRIQV